MNKYLIVTLLATIPLQLSANFLVQNNTEIGFHGTGLFLGETNPVTHQLEKIPPKSTVEIQLWKRWHFFPYAYIKFWTNSQAGDYELKISIESKGYWNLLQNSKKYMPTFIISLNKEGKPVIDGPKNEKELKEAIEKVKQERLSKIKKEVREALPQMPCGHEGIGGVTGLIAEQALEADEEPKNE